ncbi:hypothetical protein E2320_002847 [Naja naja]|nr:hypothetical protein E2320_002847 [Naja naja]
MYCKEITGKKSNVPPPAAEMFFYAYFLGFKHRSLKQLIQNDEACQIRETMLRAKAQMLILQFFPYKNYKTITILRNQSQFGASLPINSFGGLNWGKYFDDNVGIHRCQDQGSFSFCK